MERYSLNSNFTQIHAGSTAGIMQVQRGVVAIHVGTGTPDPEKCITFAAGEKWIFQTGNQLRAAAVAGAVAVVVVGPLNG